VIDANTATLITGGVLRLFDPHDLGLFPLNKVPNPPAGVVDRYEAIGVSIVIGVEYDGHAAIRLTDGTICSTNGVSLKIVNPAPVSINEAAIYTIQHAFTRTCLDLDSGSTANGAKLQGWSCQNGNLNQQWKIVNRGGGFYSLVNAGTGTSVDLVGRDVANGSPFKSWATDPYDQAQQFQFILSSADNSGVQTVFILPRFNSNKVMDLAGPSSIDGTIVHVWDNVNLPSPYQRWILSTVPIAPPPPTPLPPPSITENSYSFRHALTGTCLDLSSGSAANGAKLQGWQCSDDNLNQRWKILSRGAGVWSIVNYKSGTSVDLNSGLLTNGNIFQGWATDPNKVSQQFKLFLESVNVNSPYGEQTIFVVPQSAADSSKLLDLAGPSSADGTQVHVWDNVHLPPPAQRWIIKSIPEPNLRTDVLYTIRHALTGTCLDLDSGFSFNGAKLQGWTCLANKNQLWKLVSRGGDFYSIVNGDTGTSVDLTGGSIANGNPFHSWATEPNNFNQQFRFAFSSGNRAGQITVSVIPRLGPGKVMDLAGPSSNDGTVVHVWDNVGAPAPAQRWTLTIAVYP